MKTKQLFLNAALFLLAASLTFTGCRKKDEVKDTDTSGAEDNSLADKSFEDMGQISNEAASGSVSSYRLSGYDGVLSHCTTLTFDTLNSNDADSITVDFGSTNCLCHDGRYRRGKLYITYTAGKKYWDSLAVITIKTAPANNYFVNDNQVTGTKTVTNKGHIGGHMTWHIEVSGQIIKANNQGTITWTSIRDREWLQGEGTPQWSDDEYGVTGTAEGTSANGTQFSVTITSQLIRKMSCPKHFVSGTLDFTPGSKPVRHVDFGYSPSPNPPGSCDSWISITINSTTYYKQLP